MNEEYPATDPPAGPPPGPSLAGATPDVDAGTRRWPVVWVASFLVFNVLLDGPFSDTFGGLWRFIAEALNTGFAVVTLIVYAGSREMRAALGTLMKPLMVLAGFAAAQAVLLSVHPVVSAYALRNLTRLPLVVLGVAWFARAPKDRGFLTRLVLGVGTVESMLLLVQFAYPDLAIWQALRASEDVEVGGTQVALAYDSTYPSGTFPRYNHAAEFLLPIALLALALAIAKTRTTSTVVAAVFCVAGIAVTGSRTAQLTVALSLLPLLMTSRRKRIIGVLGAVILLAASYVYGKTVDYGENSGEGGSVLDRYLSLFATSYWETVQSGELERWPAAIEGSQSLFERHPLLGTGFGTIGSAFTNSAFTETDGAAFASFNRLPWLERTISLRAISDVGWVCLMAQGGLLGLLLIVLVYLRFARAARGSGAVSPVWSRVSLFVWLGFVVFNSTSSAFLSRSFLSSAAIILGVAIAERRASRASGGSIAGPAAPLTQATGPLASTTLNTEHPIDMQDGSGHPDHFSLVVKGWRTLATTAAIGVVISVAYALLTPKWYQAELAVLPTPSSKPNPGASLMGAVGIAFDSAFDIGGSDVERIAAVFHSSTVTDAVIAKFSLLERYKDRYVEDARKSLWEHCATKIEKKPGLVTLTCEDKSPQVAMEMAQFFAERGNVMLRQISMSSAGDERRFLETRVAEARAEVDAASRRLRDFQEKNRIVSLPEQAKAVVTSMAALRAEMLEKQVELSYLGGFSSRDEATAGQLRRQIGALESKLKSLEEQRTEVATPEPPIDAPQHDRPLATRRVAAKNKSVFPAAMQLPMLQYELEHLYREQKIQETLFAFLSQRYETARVNEARDTASFQILDRPSLPTKRIRPKRMKIVGMGFILGLCVGVGILLAPQWARRRRVAGGNA